MSQIKPAVILYFVNGNYPKPDEMLEASKINANVKFRNALAVNADEAVEPCDGVAGAVPDVYANRFPDAKTAIAAKQEQLRALAEKVGDAPVPKKAAFKKETPAPIKPDEPLKDAVPNPAAAGWQANQ